MCYAAEREGPESVRPLGYDQVRGWDSAELLGADVRHHTKDKGDVGLTAVMADLLKHDIQVALPISEHLPFDLIVIHRSGAMMKVSVKYRTLSSRGSVKVTAGSVWNDRNGTHYRRHNPGDYDAVAIYCPNTSQCYYLLATELTPRDTTLRIVDTENNQSVGIRMAHRFVDPDRLFTSAPVAQWIERLPSK